jgi:3-hydroxy-9,10-secoandrosta-1,3,5(10)-triene-9,17-dione monooxygenase reductase component
VATFDTLQLRSALGTFATGVTIITTRSPAGADVGLTVNSFNAVSLDPALVLWSLDKRSSNLPAFMASASFAVHVLAASQRGLAERFARKGADKFAGLGVSRSLHGDPVLEGCAARFECRTTQRHEGGDHWIFIGEVMALRNHGRPPLLFHSGRLTTLCEQADALVE